ncbi:MAG: hypothetical protein KatS3mg057_0879 [Herpetosiphonaceae bacterium]|nr:MAG: hypothetical protein KatS3mg057_0879 [Herpetosiphonaceae bacterium]
MRFRGYMAIHRGNSIPAADSLRLCANSARRPDTYCRRSGDANADSRRRHNSDDRANTAGSLSNARGITLA